VTHAERGRRQRWLAILWRHWQTVPGGIVTHELNPQTQPMLTALAVLKHLRTSSAFSRIALKDWVEDKKQVYVWGSLSTTGRDHYETELGRLRANSALDPFALKEMAVRHLVRGALADLPIRPNAIELVSFDDQEPPNSSRADIPSGCFMIFTLAEKALTKKVRVAGTEPRIDFEKGDLTAVMAQELHDIEEMNRPDGKPGYVRKIHSLYDDPEWLTWENHPESLTVVTAADAAWGTSCGSYAKLAAYLNSLGHRTLYGSAFTKSNVWRIIVAVELIRGSLRPYNF
jgi:hypothetical protein